MFEDIYEDENIDKEIVDFLKSADYSSAILEDYNLGEEKYVW